MPNRRSRQAGLLTERTRRALWRARHGATRHVHATEPGELVCVDTFYIGKLKGVGKVWQVTACDAATSFGAAAILPAPDASGRGAVPARNARARVAKAGWPIRRVLTDRGNEFKATFETACATLSIRDTRTKPRHALTNGFVERLQQTILHEHWRVVFRRHYFTGRTDLQRTLQGFMRFYNFERPHHGYRVRGRTPASLVFGMPALVN